MSIDLLRKASLACFVCLIVLGLAWELWLAPLRPGGSLLVLKIAPLLFALPGIARGHVRTYQWWSMLILGYLAEGSVRAASDLGPSVWLASFETLLSGLAFFTIVLYVRQVRQLRAREAQQLRP